LVEVFLSDVLETARSGIDTAKQILKLFKIDEAKILQQGEITKFASTVYSVLKEQAILFIVEAGRDTGLSIPITASAMGLLEELKIIIELESKSQKRLFAYHRYISLLDNAA